MKPIPHATLATALCLPALGAIAATPLTDAELSDIRGRDGSIVLPVGPGDDAAAGGPATLAALFAEPKVIATLDATQFAVALGEAGLAPQMIPGYEGQAVKQYRIAMRPVTGSFGAGDLLRATTGLNYAGTSLGSFTLTDFDATGTTVWSWMHR
jgi:hypothetical protein